MESPLNMHPHRACHGACQKTHANVYGMLRCCPGPLPPARHAHLNDRVSRARNARPQVSALLSDGAGDSRTCEGKMRGMGQLAGLYACMGHGGVAYAVRSCTGAAATTAAEYSPFISPFGLTMTPALSSK
eukprot:364995-Chlamydomonas_euryale.AAC.9